MPSICSGSCDDFNANKQNKDIHIQIKKGDISLKPKLYTPAHTIVTHQNRTKLQRPRLGYCNLLLKLLTLSLSLD